MPAPSEVWFLFCSLKIYIICLKVGVIGKEIIHLSPTRPIPSAVGAEPAWNQDSRIPSRSLLWVAGAQTLGQYFTASQAMNRTWNWIGSGATGTEISTYVECSVTAPSFTHCTAMPPLHCDFEWFTCSTSWQNQFQRASEKLYLAYNH